MNETADEPDNEVPRASPDAGVEPLPATSSRWGSRFAVLDVAIDLTIVTAVTVAVLVWKYSLSAVSLRVPIGYSGDGLTAGMQIKAMIEGGWVQSSDRLGAPFGQVLYDFPSGGDNGNYLILKFLSFFTHDWVLIINVFFLATFLFVGWSSYAVLRWLKVNRILAVGSSLLFVFAPYHFARGLGHLFLASYFVVPFGVAIAVKASRGELFSRGVDFRQRLLDLTPWAILCIATGSFGAYYAVFAVFAIVVLVVFGLIVRRRFAVLIDGLMMAGLVGVTFILNLSGSILYRWEHGPNPLVAQRVPIELDLYSLRISQMLSPVTGHALGPLAQLSRDLGRGFGTETGQFLGVIGSILFLALLMSVLLASFRRGSFSGADDSRPELSALVVVFTLTGVAGGLSWLLWSFGLHNIRAWNRLSIVIMFCVLAWGAVTVSIWLSRPESLGRFRKLVLFAIVLAIAGGMLDQLSYSAIGRNSQAETAYRMDLDYFSAIERQLPEGSMVYVLPYRRFPEEPPTVNSGDYDLLRPFLASRKLRWSYGGMKGRESEWQQALVGLTADEFLESIAALGFEGLLIDTQGYVDNGQALIGELSTRLNEQPLRSSDGRWAFFDVGSIDAKFTRDSLEQRRDQLIGGR